MNKLTETFSEEHLKEMYGTKEVDDLELFSSDAIPAKVHM
jgi:hypothetical protein